MAPVWPTGAAAEAPPPCLYRRAVCFYSMRGVNSVPSCVFLYSLVG